MLVVLIGGARSGKSDLAVRLAHGQTQPVTLIATAEAGDDEMSERIEQHRRERPGEWRTLEVPVDLLDAIGGVPGEDCLIVDCLTLWTANMLANGGPDGVLAHSSAAAQAAAARAGLTLVVTNEVGLGIVPSRAVGRAYRDLLGRINAQWIHEADRAYMMVAGRAVPLATVESLLADLGAS